MATLADELLNDFEDSGSEGELDRQDDKGQNESSPPPTAAGNNAQNGSIMLDGDEEEDEDEEMTATRAPKDAVNDADDEEEAKAKVEKMRLGGVNDVRNVANLMKTLEPVLEVSYTLEILHHPSIMARVYILLAHRPDVLVAGRKYHTIKISLQTSSPNSLAPSKTTQNTTCSPNQTHFLPPSITKSSSCTSTSEIIIQPASLSLKRSSAIRSTTPNQ